MQLILIEILKNSIFSERLKSQREEERVPFDEISEHAETDFGEDLEAPNKPSTDDYEYKDDYLDLPNDESPQDFSEMPRTVQTTTTEDDPASVPTLAYNW